MRTLFGICSESDHSDVMGMSLVDGSHDAKAQKNEASLGGNPDLTSLLSDRAPGQDKFDQTRSLKETLILVGKERYVSPSSAFAEVIAKGHYPTCIMKYRSDRDIADFVSRMEWLNKRFHPSVGIFVGVPDKQTSRRIEQACEPLLDEAGDCIVMLR